MYHYQNDILCKIRINKKRTVKIDKKRRIQIIFIKKVKI